MRSRSLRLRLITIFGVGTLAVTLIMGSVTFYGVRHLIIDQQERTDRRQAFVNAALLRSTLYTNPLALRDEISSIQQSAGAQIFVRINNQWQVERVNVVDTLIPAGVQSFASKNRASTQVLRVARQWSYLVGVPIPAVSAQIYQLFSLASVVQALDNLLLLIALAVLVTTALGVVGGVWVARRTTAPLVAVARAAQNVTAGDLSMRLEPSRSGTEVEALIESFNTMVDQLASRLERDARFATDVSHELRSPLTALATSISVIEQHRDALDAAARQSLTMLSTNVGVFQRLVEDLIEISRSDAGALSLSLEETSIGDVTRRAVVSVTSRQGYPTIPVMVSERAERALVNIDRRRYERILSNLIDNAHRYAGGPTVVSVSLFADDVGIDVDDHGPGVDERDRELIFERFNRGRAAFDRAGITGTGIGLALVREHVRAFGGTITVENLDEGGARFVIRLPRVNS